MREIEQVLLRFKKNIKIKCLDCKTSNEERIAEAKNILNPPSKGDINALPISDSHKELLKTHNGMTLFYKEYELDGITQESGIKIYSAEEIISETNALLLFIKSKTYIDNSAVTESWVYNIVAIGEPLNSGDKYIIDTTKPIDNDYEIKFLDHEFFFGDHLSQSDLQMLGNNIIDFLKKLTTDPIPLLERNWRHYETYLSQWYPYEIIT